MKPKIANLILLLLLVSFGAVAQKQLILMKRERVLLRLYPGDEIVFKLKNSDRIWRTYVNNLSDTSVVTHRDTIPFHKIERLYFSQEKFHNRLGAYLIAGAIALFAIDQINYTLIQGNEFSVDSGISKASIGGVLVGVPLVLARRSYQKIDYRYRLFVAKKGSPFYLPSRTIGASPYLE
ncbi:MAG TPA: hypothetical protein VGD65_24825 [Chryseosolibacter sp.]